MQINHNNILISVPDALAFIDASTLVPAGFVDLSLDAAVGYSISQQILSPIDMPPFRQSAMDGYAVRKAEKKSYRLIGEIKAGDADHPVLKIGEAVRIFTGAAVPDTADAVIMQEKVKVDGENIYIEDSILDQENIRPKGEQITKEDIALQKGTKLTPAAIGFLAGLGITKVSVFIKPSVAVIVTGNELIIPGHELLYGQIYESNASMLISALNNAGFLNITKYKVEDDFESTKNLLNTAVSTKDIVIITGGISVGDYDYVGSALQEIGVEQIFYKVKQKPGKPLFFGKKDKTAVIALPGNPAAALSCFYMYVHQLLEKKSGNNYFSLNRTHVKSLSKYVKKGNRAQFLKANVSENGVNILEGQSSAMLRTFAVSNALVFLSEAHADINIGDMVEVVLLPV